MITIAGQFDKSLGCNSLVGVFPRCCRCQTRLTTFFVELVEDHSYVPTTVTIAFGSIWIWFAEIMDLASDLVAVVV